MRGSQNGDLWYDEENKQMNKPPKITDEGLIDVGDEDELIVKKKTQ